MDEQCLAHSRRKIVNNHEVILLVFLLSFFSCPALGNLQAQAAGRSRVAAAFLWFTLDYRPRSDLGRRRRTACCCIFMIPGLRLHNIAFVSKLGLSFRRTLLCVRLPR